MFPPFPEDKASSVLAYIIEEIVSKRMKIIQVTKPSTERSEGGIMLGVLVCKDSEGNETNLFTNSGIAKQIQLTQNQPTETNLNYVPPIVSAQQIESALSENDLEIHRLTDKIKSLKAEKTLDGTQAAELENAVQLQKKLCSGSLEKVHNLYSFACADGKSRTIKEICAQYNSGKLPPTGTGDCCAPKLLHYAYTHGLTPVSMAESFFDVSRVRDWNSAEGVPGGNGDGNGAPDAELCKARRQPAAGTPGMQPKIELSSPCDSRCGILLPAMLGLKILYRDENIIVVDKQSGLLSVPGRGPEKQDCIVNRVKKLFPQCIEQPSVHRLDMETSGLLVLAFTKEAHRELNRQFENREVHKEYEALLDGVLAKKGIAKTGTMELFFRLDVDNRPHQIWDSENGKSAVTEWEILGVERYRAPDGSVRSSTRMRFIPHTGRTHQLRLASADEHGFGVPIIGDTLYGKCEPGERLMLHAKKLSFRHPVTGEEMRFECSPGF